MTTKTRISRVITLKDQLARTTEVLRAMLIAMTLNNPKLRVRYIRRLRNTARHIYHQIHTL